ncbi:MAG: hypothetical protein DRP45_08965, partial [Candidatus Zixiibacteriota bacterium]
SLVPLEERLDPFDADESQLANLLAEHPRMSLVSIIKKQLLGFNETMAREVMRRSCVDEVVSGNMTEEQVVTLAASIRDMAVRFRETSAAYLYSFGGRPEAYPFKLRIAESQPEKYKSLSLATMALVSRRQSNVEEASEEKQILKAVSRAVKRLQRRIGNIERDVTEAENFERYKRWGELLQLHRDSIKKGMTSIVLQDLIAEDPQEVEVPLDPALSPNENIANCFKRHRKGREGLQLLKRRLEISQGELESLLTMQQELEVNFDSAQARYESELASLMPSAGEKAVVQRRLPYREAVLSTGVKVFVGRDGSDNDQTTFEFARPYELWFHAQQCAGSHVVMKFPTKSFEPSKKEIEETAAIAAYHSKARNNSLVPVAYTQRKYVRKPRKAKPGLVTVEREKSIMVEPRKPEK